MMPCCSECVYQKQTYFCGVVVTTSHCVGVGTISFSARVLQRLHDLQLLQSQAAKGIYLVTVARNLVGNEVVVKLAEVWLLLEV